MTSTAYEAYRVTPKSSADSRGQPSRGFFIRVMDAFAESRQRSAMIEITRHAHLLSPSWLEQQTAVSSRARRGSAGGGNRGSAARSPV